MSQNRQSWLSGWNFSGAGGWLHTPSFFSSLQQQNAMASGQATGSFTGSRTYGPETINHISGAGALALNGTTVTGNVQVSGTVFAEQASIQNFNVSGSANLIGTQVHGHTEISGALSAKNSLLNGNATIASENILLEGSSFNTILVKQTENSRAGVPQIIELREGTNGQSIHFESGHGQVNCYPGSSVIQVIGGQYNQMNQPFNGI